MNYFAKSIKQIMVNLIILISLICSSHLKIKAQTNCLLNIDLVSSENISFNQTNDGSVTLVISGSSGIINFAFILNGNLINTGTISNNGTYNINNLEAGFWSFIMTDNLGCTTETNAIVFNYNFQNCDEIMVLPYQIQIGIYNADDIIYCSGIINENSLGSVGLYAGAKNDNTEFIELQNGFYASGYYNFEAVNVDCNKWDNQNCPLILNINSSLQNGSYTADDRIYCSSNQIYGNVILNAGAKNDNSEFIALQNGFYADGLYNFEAINMDCNPNDN